MNATSISLPPLRDRRADILPLVAHLFEKFNRMFERRVTRITREALQALELYDWPGNVRELHHAIESASLSTDNHIIALEDLPQSVSAAVENTEIFPDRPQPAAAGAVCDASPVTAARSFTLQEALDYASKQALQRALNECAGNFNRAAKLLGVSRYTVYRMVNRYALKVVRNCRVAA